MLWPTCQHKNTELRHLRSTSYTDPPRSGTPTANVRAQSMCGARVYGTNQISQTSLGWGSSAVSAIVPRRRHVLDFTHASAKYNRSRIKITDLSSVTRAAFNHSSRISPASLISQRFHKFWERLKKYSGWDEQRWKIQKAKRTFPKHRFKFKVYNYEWLFIFLNTQLLSLGHFKD